MTIPRKEIIREKEEGIYHCIAGCVRRAFLCGYDRLTGRSFEHRKKWIDERLKQLSSIFAVDVGGKAIMGNHLHTVLRNRPDISSGWDNLEVARRWRRLYPRRQTKAAREFEIRMLSEDEDRIKVLRARLQSISWFMKSLNEYIARKANEEDGCKGRFWEGRFKSIELADESAILSCLVYVDLNPVRAQMAKIPEKSDFTSIQERIIGKRSRDRLKELGIDINDQSQVKDIKDSRILRELELSSTDQWLSPISYGKGGQRKGLVSMSESEYFKIVDFSGRIVKAGKRGSIPEEIAPILTRLHIDLENWVTTISEFDSLFCRVSGRLESLMDVATRTDKTWIKGYSASRKCFVNC